MVLTSTEGQKDLPRYFAQVHRMLHKMEAGRLDIVLPDGRRFRTEGKKPGPVAQIDVHHPDLFSRLIREGDLGFSDAYLEEWRRADPVECGDELAQEADNACAAIETGYDKDRLKSLINNEGWAQPR